MLTAASTARHHTIANLPRALLRQATAIRTAYTNTLGFTNIAFHYVPQTSATTAKG